MAVSPAWVGRCDRICGEASIYPVSWAGGLGRHNHWEASVYPGWVGYRSPKADSPGRAGLTDSHLNMNTSCGRHNHWEASIYPVWQAGSGIGPGSEGRGWVQADSSQAGRLGRVDSSQAGWLGWADLPRWAWVRPGGWVGKAAPRAGLGGEAPGERRGKG